MACELRKPSLALLPGYAAALGRGWSPDNLRPAAAGEQLEKIAADAAGFVERLDDPEARAGPVTLPDGSTVSRLPGFNRWIWDGEFCGNVGFRWQPGTSSLPPYALGHIGYAVVPWKRGRGYATRALALILPEARAQGLEYVELTADPGNAPSIRVIEVNGGRLVERFRKSAAHGGTESVRYRIDL